MKQEYRDEAERLALTPRAEQEAIVQWLKDIAANSKAKKADRQLADEKAKALASLLFRPKKPKKIKHEP